MVYQRKFIVKGFVYYQLVKCERDKNGNPKQKYLKYLGANPLKKETLEHYSDIAKDLKPHEKKLTEIFHSIHKNSDSLIKYDELIIKAQNNGIDKKLVNEYLELYIDKKIKLKVITSKKFETNLSKNILDKIDIMSRKLEFPRPTLEKVTRIYYIFNALNNIKLFKENFAIFGGTAINGIYKKWPRMSVDLDLQYIGNCKKEDMEKIRKKIEKDLFFILTKLNYEPKIIKISGGVSKYKANYIMKNGHKEHIKFDINMLNRVSILPLTKKEFSSPLDPNTKFLVNTYQSEELYAKKFIALSEREASRDVFDISNMDNIDIKKFTKTLICCYILNQIDIKNLIKLNMNKFNINDFSKELIPTLRKSENINPKELLSKTQKIVVNIQKNLTKKDIDFHKSINKKNPQFEKLFGNIKFNQDINKSPLLETIKKS